MARVIVQINPETQEVTYTTEGFAGNTCLQVTEELRIAHDEADMEYTGQNFMEEIEIGE